MFTRIVENIEKVMRGQGSTIRKLLAGLASGGHVLIEDIPGTGKTTLAKALAKSLDLHFSRVQFTPDLLPSDILGVSIYEQNHHAFRFHKGPIFTNILLADEINRASPRTQSALLEAMAEGQVTVDGERYHLEQPFFVIATQNPLESRGVYPLPEAQMDRFALKLKLGYISEEDELAILDDQAFGHPLEKIQACLDRQEFAAMQQEVRDMHMDAKVKGYIVALVRASRAAEGVMLGASPRAALALMHAAKALARFDRLSFVTPDHVQEIAREVIAHRLILEPHAEFSGHGPNQVVEDLLKAVLVPR